MPEPSENHKISATEEHGAFSRQAPPSPVARAAEISARRPVLSLMLSVMFTAASLFIGISGYKDSPLTTAAVSVFFAALGGLLLGFIWYGRRLNLFESACNLATVTDHAQGLRSVKTGVPVLDAHLLQIARKIVGLLEIIDSVQSNSEDILERYRIVTQNIAASIVIRDINGKIIYANPYTEVLTGYPLKEALEAKDDFLANLVVDEDREKYRRALKITAMGEGYNFIYRALHKTGMEMWFETRTEPVLNDEGEVQSFLSVTMDITRLMRYQKQVEEKNRDLQDFAYMVSHDLKAPIVTIRGMIGLLEEDLTGRAAQEETETLEHIRLALGRLDQLVASVLQYSRISAAETAQEDVKLGDVFTDIINDYTEQIKQADAKIQITDEASASTVSADRLKIYQILCNLIGNAIKFRDKARSPVIDIRLEPTRMPREVLISVSDNGIGIPPDRIDSIFRPFHRAHGKAYEGTGIGLACVKRLLEKIGGSIRVESRENEGTRFYVSLKKSINLDPLVETAPWQDAD